MTATNPAALIAREINVQENNVAAVLALLAEGGTVPFIARYRKEATGNLDEVQIRTIEERHQYIVELDKRRDAVLTSIKEQGKLTAELEKKIRACDTKSALEDLYLPYRPKRRTRATIAKEKGLDPLAHMLLSLPEGKDAIVEAEKFVSEEKGVADAQAALAGARDIVAEIVAESADVRQVVREAFMNKGVFISAPAKKAEEGPTKYEQYYDFREAVATIPSHRYLAIRRGEREGLLRVGVDVDRESLTRDVRHTAWPAEKKHVQGTFATELEKAIADSVERLLCPSIETDVRVDIKMRADVEAVEIFARNLRNLLLASPLGQRPVIGIDPGLRTGCKCVAVDATGKFLDTVTIFPSRGEARVESAKDDLLRFIAQYQPFAIGVGNGTGGRETESFVRQLLRDAGVSGIVVVTVNESGASVYSASDIAREEFPELDLTIRGAISIARRLQDPLAELVKIDPKAIGVGQYQHDVHQPLLQRKLAEVVESCVNHVGVELNTASAPLLSQVAGITPSVAKRIVEHRNSAGAFRNRKDLLQIAGLGPKAFEQCAGFLRIQHGEHPLDASAVHPERYEVVDTIAQDLGVPLTDLVGNPTVVKSIDIAQYSEKFREQGVGVLTLKDIVDELQKPGRDPRKTFEAPKFREDVSTLQDLTVGMHLEGVVTNVTAFGAFVDIGVHQDGLVHVSELSDRFVKDPNDVVKAGDRLKVWVLEVDLARKRIALSAKSPEAKVQKERQPGNRPGEKSGPMPKRSGGPRKGDHRAPGKPKGGFSNNPFANLLGRS